MNNIKKIRDKFDKKQAKLAYLKENYSNLNEISIDETLKYNTFADAYNKIPSFKESIDLFGYGQFGGNNSGVMGNIWTSNGALWQGTSGYGSPSIFITYFVWLSTLWFNRYQRFAARYLTLSASPATTAVNTCVDLIYGTNGFDYKCKSKSGQKRIDQWLKENKWKDKSKKIIHDFFVDGDVFVRKFGDQVRFIDPDLVYQMTGATDRSYLGILYSPNDTEDIQGYEVHNSPYGANSGDESEIVDAEDVFHLANSYFGLLRGFSWFLPIFPDVFNVDRLQTTLGKTMIFQASIGAIRQHQSPLPGVLNMQSQISSQPQNNNIGNPMVGTGATTPIPIHHENIEPGAIIDSSQSYNWDIPKIYDSAKFIETIDMILRKISSHFAVPNSIYSNDKSERGAYASEVSSSSWLASTLGARQQRFMDYDKKIISSCCEIDEDDIKVTGSTIGGVDKKAEVEEEMFMREQGILSAHTLAKRKGLNYDEEQEHIKTENEENIKSGVINNNDEESKELRTIDRTNGIEG